jgi:glycosyltransferase involved in cell wall biosynthesis
MGQKVMPVGEQRDVLITGFLDDDTKASAIAGATALVCPSPYESLSIVALEAWAHGTPVLVNAQTPVLLGQVQRSGGGLWYRDDHDYTTMVRLLLELNELARGLGEAGRNWVTDAYSPASIRGAWLSVLSEVAIGSSAPA